MGEDQPIVEDQLVYRDASEKSLGYDIEEGITSVMNRQNLQDRAGVKKSYPAMV